MNTVIIALSLIAAFFLALAIFVQKSKLRDLELRNGQLAEFEKMYRDALLEKIALSERCKNLLEKIEFLENSEEKLTNTFKAISSDVISRNNQSFLDLAKTTFEQLQEKTKSDLALSAKSVGELVSPIRNALEGVGNRLGELEKARVGAYEALKQQVSDLISAQNLLKTETNHLVSALKTPNVSGRWGEIQLRRVVEIAGMVEHCDFDEQALSEKDDAKFRPDMVIYFPDGRQVVVDAKVSLSAYLKAMETEDEKNRKDLLKKHANQIRAHISSLSNKKYWTQFRQTPEFVIMFLPREVFFSAAVEQDPSLQEFAMREKVIISTPTLLLALLQTVAFGWSQQSINDNAQRMVDMGRELYKRLANMSGHVIKLGNSIKSTVSAYNKTIANFEGRVLATARKFDKLEWHEKDIAETHPVEDNVRDLRIKGTDY
ncbi:MAG: DNA recombination protein RmuC [Holosporaceae bacterium]|jgi:DNA recombination protein RmuC|nr:DNA recombination protein RmuC [Holosporaceae bacterium]